VSVHTPVHPAPHEVDPVKLQQMYPSLAQSEVKLHPPDVHELELPEMQTPLEHVYPASHVVPSQHASSSVPHVVVVLVQMPFEQVPLTHAEPLQHAWPTSPQDVDVFGAHPHHGDERAPLLQQSCPLSVAQSLSVLHVSTQLPAAAQ